jgi:hypothetical protein
MVNTNYYVKKVRKNDKGQIKKLKTSKELDQKPKKIRKRKKVVKHLKRGKNIRTAFLEEGQWKAGDKIRLHKKKWLTTEGNQEERDNLGNLGHF